MYSAYDHLAVGLPHSDIRGSTIARISPRLFAACYVLHRLLVPRHPPNALQRLISTFPRNHPSSCEPGRPISLLIPRQPRQPPQDARTHNFVPPGLRSESRSSARRHEVLTRNSPSNTRRSSRSRQSRKAGTKAPAPHDKTAASKSKRQYPLHHVKQHKLRAEARSPTASSTTPWILCLSDPTEPHPHTTQKLRAGGGGRD